MEPTPTPGTETVFEGIAASPGISYGQAFTIVQRDLEIPSYRVDKERREDELARFDQAILTTREQIKAVHDEVEKRIGPDEARIFDAHLLVLEDQALLGETVREFEASSMNIETCFHKAAQRYIDAFDQIADEYLRERATDIRDVTRRVIRNLLGLSGENLGKQVKDRVVVAADISPMDSAAYERGRVQAIITERGGKASHTVIMARSMCVPAVVGVRGATQAIQSGEWVLVDGYDGIVIVNPTERTLFRYGKIQRQRRTLESRVSAEAHLPTETLDGVRITQRVNIEGPDDLWKLREFAHDGVGLFRTEYLFLNSPAPPTEQQQYEAYRAVAEAVAPHPVVIRTLDLGGDKPMSQGASVSKPEANPFLGLRAIRYCLGNPQMFRCQMRAILRASAVGNVRMMYPMISGLEELAQANELLGECRAELQREGVAFDPAMPVGCMVEIPSAAVIADLLAKRSAFFSIGTNDLIQYLLAIDRVNEQIAHLYEPSHPAVLRTVRHIVEAAHREGIHVAVCGEMAGDPAYAPLLIGMGVDELSMAPGMFTTVKFLVRRMRAEDAVVLATEALTLSDPKQVRRLTNAFYQKRIAEVVG